MIKVSPFAGGPRFNVGQHSREEVVGDVPGRGEVTLGDGLQRLPRRTFHRPLGSNDFAGAGARQMREQIAEVRQPLPFGRDSVLVGNFAEFLADALAARFGRMIVPAADEDAAHSANAQGLGDGSSPVANEVEDVDDQDGAKCFSGKWKECCTCFGKMGAAKVRRGCRHKAIHHFAREVNAGNTMVRAKQSGEGPGDAPGADAEFQNTVRRGTADEINERSGNLLANAEGEAASLVIVVGGAVKLDAGRLKCGGRPDVGVRFH